MKKPNADRFDVDTELSLSGSDTGPMGASVFRFLSQKAFTNDSLSNNIRSFEKWHTELVLDGLHTDKMVYIIAAPRMVTTEDEVELMVDFVERGNVLLVISDYFTENFLQWFSVDASRTLLEGPLGDAWEMRATKKSLTDSNFFQPRQFGFYYYPFLNEVSADSSHEPTEYPGLNDAGKPDFLRVRRGKGQLLLLTNAAAFSNYFLLTNNNHHFALGVLSYLPAFSNGVFWDDFYRRHPYRALNPPSLLSTILSIPGFRWAFGLLLAAGILWIGTEIWRRQRLIPVQDDYKNTSLEFNQTIARLYLNNHDNRNIALKMIAHLKEYLQTRFFIRNIEMDDELAEILSAKTGMEKSNMKALTDRLKKVQEGESPDDLGLLWINQEIQQITSMGAGLVHHSHRQRPKASV